MFNSNSKIAKPSQSKLNSYIGSPYTEQVAKQLKEDVAPYNILVFNYDNEEEVFYHNTIRCIVISGVITKLTFG